jgi:transposase InsO family protein
MTWSQFLKSHWSVLTAADFFGGPRGLVTFYVLFVIESATRRVEIAGINPNPNEAWMMQVAKNLTDANAGFLAGKRFPIVDRDSKYSLAFRTLLNESGIEMVRLPARSPNLNPFAGRFVRSIKSECLSRMIFFGERSLRKATLEYAAHYHTERNHQGIENRSIESDDRQRSATGAIDCSSRLGGMLRFYHRAVA